MADRDPPATPAIPYCPADLQEPAELVAAIRRRRGGQLFNLDRMLLHSPPFAHGWNIFMGAVRGDLSVSRRLQELAICVVAVLNGAEYEFGHHAPLYEQAGASAAHIAALRAPDIAAENPLFDAAERATIRLTVAMTRTIAVSPVTITELQRLLPDTQALIELIGTIAAYNMVSRFLVATGVTPE